MEFHLSFMSTVGHLVTHFDNLSFSAKSEKNNQNTKRKSKSKKVHSENKVKKCISNPREVTQSANKNKEIDGNVSNKSITLPCCSKDLTEEVNKDCDGTIRKTLSKKERKISSSKKVKLHSDSLQKDLEIKEREEYFTNLKNTRTAVDSDKKSKTVETSFLNVNHSNKQYKLNNTNSTSFAKEETTFEEQIKQKLNELKSHKSTDVTKTDNDINQQKETVLKLVDTSKEIEKDTEKNIVLVPQETYENYKDESVNKNDTTTKIDGIEDKEITEVHPSDCFDDIFGCNDFNEDEDDNYIVEAKNSVGQELAIMTLEIIRYTDRPVKKREKINYIIEEIVESEEKYIHSLKRVVEDYMPFVNNETRGNLIGKNVYIFGNIEVLYENAKKFLKLLKQKEQDPNSIAQLFIDNAKMFELYPLYSKNKPTANMYLKKFDEIIKVRQAQLKDELNLASYLLTPIQRLGKYVLLLEKIETELKKKGESLETVTNAIYVIQNVMRQENNLIAIDSIKQSDIDLKLQGSFIMSAFFNILKPRKFASMVFLFENVVVFTEEACKNAEQFRYVDSIDINVLTLVRDVEDKPLAFQLTNYARSKRIGHEEATYVLETESPDVKNEWIKVISKKLWMQFENAKAEKQINYPNDRHQTKSPQ